MDNHSPEKKFEDRMNKNISLEDFRNEKANRIISLRKKKHNNDTIIGLKGKINILYEKHYTINLNHLKTNNDDIRNFSINLQKDKSCMDKLKYLLESNDDNEVKYGLFATRKFFQNLMRELYYKEDGNIIKINSLNEIKKCKEIDIFIKYNIIDLIFQIMNKSIDKNEIQYYINIYESLWICINMAGVMPEEQKYRTDYFKTFVKNEYLNIYINIIKNTNTPQEIILNLLMFLTNLSYQESIDSLINSSLTQVLFTYLKANKNINSDVLVHIYKILHILCSNYKNLNIDAYRTIFKIFSLPLYNFKNKELLNYCLLTLISLSEQNNPQIIQMFNDINFFSALNDIIFNDTIKDNENLINLILELFYNLILKENNEIQNNIINSRAFIEFYKNLLIKYKNENIIMYYKIDENIITSVNNLIMFKHSENIKYILGEGREILNYFMDRARAMYRNLRFWGTKSMVNVLIDTENEIDINIIHEIANIIISTLNEDCFNNCFVLCLQAIYLIINKSEKMKFTNELKIYLNTKGFLNILEKLENQLLNNAQKYELNSEDIEDINLFDLINNIKHFLIN